MRVSDFVCDHNIYYGHINEKNKSVELLDNHIDLVNSYYESIKKEKNINRVLKKIYDELEINNKYYDLFLSLTDALISAHDWGKVNPKFQSERLYNNIDGPDLGITTKHSILSAALYLYYYIDYINNLEIEVETLEKLQYILFLNAYIISKHHSDLDDFKVGGENFFDYFSDENENIGKTLEKIILSRVFTKNFSNNYKDKIDNIFDTEYYILDSTNIEKFIREKSKVLYVYQRLMYSLLVASDFYATTEFMNNYKSKKESIDKQSLIEIYNNSALMQSIRWQEETKSYNKKESLNDLRTKIFLEVEKSFERNRDKNIFFLESPTGSGKSNIAMNISYKLLKNDMDKIIYAYPFNTLVEQNRETLREYYKDSEVGRQISVLNSATEIGNNINEEGSIEEKNYYIKALQDRQFLHSPFILTSNVALFEILFSNKRSSIFGLYQLANSVIVLDEIQAYKEKIWNETIEMLSEYAEILNMKIIIMSATLPDLSKLLDENNKSKIGKLIENPRNIFNERLFRNRVRLNYELLDKGKIEYSDLIEHMRKNISGYNKVLLEFIKRDNAENFYEIINKDENFKQYKVFILTGADNSRRKKEIVGEIKSSEEKLILVATQVIEAGVDIDMDIGYKDISKLENEEQFLGRINRSAKKSNSVAFFFDMANEVGIYGQIDNELTLRNENRRKNLEDKDFEEYFNLKINKAKENKDGLNYIEYKKALENNLFATISKHMKLIDRTDEVNIFINQKIEIDGEEIYGNIVWGKYKNLLYDYKLDYSRKIVELSKLKVEMSNFMYKLSSNKFKRYIRVYNDFVGNIYYLDNGEEFIKDGRLRMPQSDLDDDLFI